MSPIVAAETVNIAFYALAAASVFILLYVWYAFVVVCRRPIATAVSAVLALVHDMLVILGVFSILGRVIGFEVNSMFIVGLLIVAGYSVNDTIVVFDRIRENVSRHPDRDLGGLVNMSIMETMGRSLNTSLTTLFRPDRDAADRRSEHPRVAAGAGHRARWWGPTAAFSSRASFLVMWDRGEIRRFGRARQTAATAVSTLVGVVRQIAPKHSVPVRSGWVGINERSRQWMTTGSRSGELVPGTADGSNS